MVRCISQIMISKFFAIFLIAKCAHYVRAASQFPPQKNRRLVSDLVCLDVIFSVLVFALVSALVLVSESVHAADPAPTLTAFSNAIGTQPPVPWRPVGLPNKQKPLTRMDITTLDGEHVLRLASDKSYGTLYHALPDLLLDPQATLRWKWRLDQPLPAADLRRKEGDDAALKVCALFDLPLNKLGLVERSMMRMARSVSGENLPAATLCYVWDHHLPNGTELANAYTRRVRYVVLNSGDGQLKQWITHERKLAVDFQRVFKDDLGSEAAALPALIAIVVGADSDNTGGTSLGFIGDITMKP